MRSRLLSLLLLCGACQLHAAEAPPDALSDSIPVAETPAAAEEELDEVVVQGTRLWQMREAIVEAEERFYALYNELNTNDDFDLRCRQEAPLGTRLKKRICRVAFHEEAMTEQAQALLRGGYAPDPQMVLLQRNDEYRKNVQAVVNGNRRLRNLLRERARLEEKYKEEHRRRFKDRWIIIE